MAQMTVNIIKTNQYHDHTFPLLRLTWVHGAEVVLDTLNCRTA